MYWHKCMHKQTSNAFMLYSYSCYVSYSYYFTLHIVSYYSKPYEICLLCWVWVNQLWKFNKIKYSSWIKILELKKYQSIHLWTFILFSINFMLLFIFKNSDSVPHELCLLSWLWDHQLYFSMLGQIYQNLLKTERTDWVSTFEKSQF